MIDVVDPSTERIIATLAQDGPAEVDTAVRGARAAWPAWAATPLEERLDVLERLADALAARQDQLGRTLAEEMGMPLAQATAVQAVMPVGVLRATVAAARVHPWESVSAGATVVREPAGVVAAITPWNFPLHQIAAKVGPALAAGCTVVLKPSELAPLNAFVLMAAAEEAGVPKGVLTLVLGTGPVTGEALVCHPEVDVVTLTGSVRAGRRVGALAGEGLKRVCLELGGKSPSLVLADADVDAAVRHCAERCFLNAGQACNAPTRLLVPEAARADAEALAAQVADALVVGPAMEDGVTMGPVISADARTRIHGFVEEAAAQGAQLVAGARDVARERGFFVAPTVLTGVEPGARVAQEEVFGPVLTVFGYRDEAHAVELANSTKYGLSAELWSGDPGHAGVVARQLRCGQVKVNGVRARDTLAAPFGGYGQSGVGRELGPFGLDEFCEVKAVLGVG